MTEEKQTQKTNKKVVIGVAVFVVLVVILGAIYFVFRAKPVEGAKAITIEVVDDEHNSTTYEVHTDAEFLRQAMEEAEDLVFTGTESEYGLMIDTINGVTADYAVNGAYWSFYVNDEYCNYGVDSQPVMDGDVFQIVYTVDVFEE